MAKTFTSCFNCVFFSLFFLTTFCFSSIQAQDTGQIKGHVTVPGTTKGIPGVNVYLEGGRQGTVTDVSGAYTISNVAPGNYTLVIRSIGYEIRKEPIVLAAGQTLELSFALNENITELGGVIVRGTTLTGGGASVDDIPGSVHYIDAKDLEKFSYNDIHRILRNIPGINIQEEMGS